MSHPMLRWLLALLMKGGSADPQFVASRVTAKTATDRTFDLPASGILAGDFILAFVVVGGGTGASFTWPAGWTELVSANTIGSAGRYGVGYRLADGSENDANVNLTSSNSNSLIVRVTASVFRGVNSVQISSQAGATNAAPNSPSFTPTGGSRDYLWISGFFLDPHTASVVSAVPANYAGVANYDANVAMAYRRVTAASEDPGAWTLTASETWEAYTLALYKS